MTNGSYKVRVRSATIGDLDTPPRGGLNATVPGTWPYPLAEMTWANGAARYGGQSATVDDTATGDNGGPGDTYAALTLSGSSVANVDFGFAYNLIVNADDDANADGARSKQGGAAAVPQERERDRGGGRDDREREPVPHAGGGEPVERRRTRGGGSRRPSPCPASRTAEGPGRFDAEDEQRDDSNSLGPEIEIDGISAGAATDGLTVTAERRRAIRRLSGITRSRT